MDNDNADTEWNLLLGRMQELCFPAPAASYLIPVIDLRRIDLGRAIIDVDSSYDNSDDSSYDSSDDNNNTTPELSHGKCLEAYTTSEVTTGTTHF